MRPLPRLLACLAVAFGGPAAAHGMRTAYVELRELEPGSAAIRVSLNTPDPGLRLTVPDSCQLLSEGAPDDALQQPFRLECPGELAGRTIGLRGLGTVFGDVVVSVSLHDGTTASHLLRTGSPTWTLPAHESFRTVALQYVGLGLAHILTGADHLLFLLLLVLVLKRPRPVLLAETAFTLSHSLSFTATALGWIHVFSPAAETCIALSLLLVALDVGAPDRRTASTAGGALLAFVFGSVHGLGFAGGLQEVGLPDHEVAAALVSFGAGVELGQVAFLAVALLAVHFAQRLAGWALAVQAAGYAAGTLSAYWLIQRLWICFNP